MTAFVDEELSCNKPTPRRPVAGRRFLKYLFLLMEDVAFVKLVFYKYTLWYGNLKSRTLIGKEYYKHDPFDAHDVFSYARPLTAFCCPYFVMYLLLGLIKVNASDDICERSTVVLRELFQQLFGDFLPEQVFPLLLGDGVFVLHLSFSFLITSDNCMSSPYRDANAFSYILSCKFCISINQSFTFSTILGEAAVFGRRA
jgi:hypothetical protein